MFKLHVIQAQFGDSLLIEYGEAASKFILIDGGPAGVYNDSLRPALDELVSNHELEAVMISHIDMDHIKGILDMLTELQRQQDAGEEPFIKIKELWLNSFTKTIDTGGDITNDMNTLATMASAAGIQVTGSSAIAINGVKEGHNVTRLCKILKIPMNKSAQDNLFCVDTNPDTITFGNLAFTIIGPTKANLDALQKEWQEWLKKKKAAIAAGTLDLLGMTDKSVPNLSSIAFLVKGNEKTIFFTGDSRGDFLVEGLAQQGLLKNNSFHCDVLKVQHHGSDRDADQNFFEQVTADTYVISANGKYDNPDIETLGWIVKAAKKQGRQARLIITNQTESTKQLKKDFPPQTNNYTIEFLANDKSSILI